MFRRMDLNFRTLQAEPGAIGGTASEEFQVLADSGEDAIAISDADDFAANIQLAPALAPAAPLPPPPPPATGAHPPPGRPHHRAARRAAQGRGDALPEDPDRQRRRRHAGSA